MSGIIGGAGSKSGVIGTTELDYEEGEWTATSANGGVSSYGNQTGNYTKIGRMVHVQLYSGAWATNHAIDPYITGLPFTSSSKSNSYSGGYSFHDTWNPGSSAGFIPTNSETIRFVSRDVTGYNQTPSSGDHYIMFIATYFID